jgi:hypothetical protein
MGNFPELQRRLDAVDGLFNLVSCSVLPARTGLPTILAETGNRTAFLHSGEDPRREAEELVNSLQGQTAQHVLFYGIGLGYHIDLFQRMNPNIPFSIFEPSISVFRTFAHQGPEDLLLSSMLRNVGIGSGELEASMFIRSFVDKTRGQITLCALPGYQSLFMQQLDKFGHDLHLAMQYKESNLAVSHHFSDFWTFNSIRNFQQVLQMPNLFQKRKHFVGKPAVIVSAGPSLEQDIEVLRKIKEGRRAYLFSAGSALNTLLSHDLMPDAACTYDPQPHNDIVFQKMLDMGIDTLPIVFGSSVGGSLMQVYQGPKFHFLTSQDSVTPGLLGRHALQWPVINDATSIAIVTLQILAHLGCNPIILSGQNFAYLHGRHYAGGIPYGQALEEPDPSATLSIKDVFGQAIRTSPSLFKMKQEMEGYIRAVSPLEVINTTSGGAAIEGAPFMEMARLLEQKLSRAVVDPEWMALEPNPAYSVVDGRAGISRMNDAADKAARSFEEWNAIFQDMSWYAKKGLPDKLEKLFPIFDQAFERWKDNPFSQVFLIPLCRVNYERLYQQVESVRYETDPMRKAAAILQYFGGFMRTAIQALDKVKPAYLEMVNKLEGFSVLQTGKEGGGA